MEILHRVGCNSEMTKAQQIQYDRFIKAGYIPEDAALLIKRGVWLGTKDMSEQTVDDIQRYRAERDAEAHVEGDPIQPF